MPDRSLPGDRRDSQPTVLVSGHARALLHRVPLQLLAERATGGDGAVIVSTREDPAVPARRLCEAVPSFEPARVALVDATIEGRGTLTRVDDRRWRVPSPVAFGHVRSAVDGALDELAVAGVDRVHVLFDTLTSQFRLADADVVQRHANDVAMSVGSECGLGLFTLEPSAVDEAGFERVRHLVDVHVAVRRTDDGPQVRWTGLVGRSAGWQPLVDAGVPLTELRRTRG